MGTHDQSCGGDAEDDAAEVFSGEIVSCFVPLDIGGACYQGVTGAQTLNVTIDYLLWGVESQDDTYRAYAQANLGEQLPPHRELVAHAVDRPGARRS